MPRPTSGSRVIIRWPLALSHALDLTEGQSSGHTLRCCLIGMRLGDAMGNVGLGQPLRVRRHHFRTIASTPDLTRGLIQVRCERGANIARSLGFSEATARAIRSLDEHWDGQGYPDGLRGTEIPVLARIANLAQVVEVFHHEHGLRVALRMARQRRGATDRSARTALLHLPQRQVCRSLSALDDFGTPAASGTRRAHP